MGNQILVIGATCALSFLAGAATALVFVSESLEGITETGSSEPNLLLIKQVGRNEARLRQMSASMDRQFDALRREVIASADAAGASGVGHAPSAAPPGSGTAAAGTPGFATRDRPGTLAPPRLDQLEGLRDWDSNRELRSKWLLTSQDTALAAFGSPDELVVHEGEEWWAYWVSDGEHINEEYRLRFHQGRLVGSQHVTWKKPRQRPGTPDR